MGRRCQQTQPLQTIFYLGRAPKIGNWIDGFLEGRPGSPEPLQLPSFVDEYPDYHDPSPGQVVQRLV